MSDGVGLSVGATNLAAVVVGRTAVTRSPVVTLYPHRPPEVGVPSENPNLTERGLIITDFVDRVGDPVGIVAADGSTHLADKVLADALRAMLYTVAAGHPPDPSQSPTPRTGDPPPSTRCATPLAAVPEFQQPTPAPLVSDATAALTALQDDPGVPTRGVIALCDFGGTGTSITLVDAANGFAPIGPTVRHTDLSGDLIDQALLTHVINDLSAAGTIDLSGTSAIGSLTRLRAQCRGAKERLSTTAVTSLVAELPGHRSEVRLTRNELDEAIRAPLADFVGVVQETLERNGIRTADLVAVASVGGGARIPIITTTLSEHFRVPVITTGQPELTAAIGGGLQSGARHGRRGQDVDGRRARGGGRRRGGHRDGARGAPTGRARIEHIPALAWSDADDVPDVAPTDPYEYGGPANGGGSPPTRARRCSSTMSRMRTKRRRCRGTASPLSILVAGVLALLAALDGRGALRDARRHAPRHRRRPPRPSPPPRRRRPRQRRRLRPHRHRRRRRRRPRPAPSPGRRRRPR